jgi:hypothetical protein
MSKAEGLSHIKGVKMFVLDFKKEFRSLPGEETESEQQKQNLSRVLAFVLSRSEDNVQPMKLWEWAIKLATDGILKLDKTDMSLLRQVILTNKMLYVSAKGQMIEVIDSAVEEK